MATDPRTIQLRSLRKGKGGLDNLINEMLSGEPVLAPHIRKAIDNLGEARNVLHLDGELKKRYEAFKTAVENTEKKEKKIQFQDETFTRGQAEKIINTVEGKGEAKDRFKYRELGESARPLMGKLFKDMKGVTEMGHKDISILAASMASLLVRMSPTDPRRGPLKALLAITQKVDKLTEEPDLTLEEFINLEANQISSPVNVGASAKVVVDAIRGLEGSVDFVMELQDINNKKSELSKKLGKLLNQVVQSDLEDFEKAFKDVDISQLKGSPTIAQHIGAQVRDVLDPNKRHKKATLKPKNAKGKKPNSGTAKRKKPKSRRLSTIVLAKRKKEKAKASAVSLTNLLGIINGRLPDKVAKNMGAPGLENRSGRFAGSVRAVDVNITPQGFPSVGFTYRKDPYQVFETTSGTRFSSAERDPRNIIGRSIREIALESGITKLFTRRV